MIYCVPVELYPSDGLFIEELTYQDENDFEWRIARIQNGFMVRYFGDDYFKYSMFCCQLKDGSMINIKNTNCIFVKDSTFETFCNVRDIIKNGYTDDIWETFEELFTERFNNSEELLESEIY